MTDFNGVFAFLKDLVYGDHLCPYCTNELKKYDDVIANDGNTCKFKLRNKQKITECEGFVHA